MASSLQGQAGTRAVATAVPDLAALPLEVQSFKTNFSLGPFWAYSFCIRRLLLLCRPARLLSNLHALPQHPAVLSETSFFLRGRCLQTWWQSCAHARLYSFSACRGKLTCVRCVPAPATSPSCVVC